MNSFSSSDNTNINSFSELASSQAATGFPFATMSTTSRVKYTVRTADPRNAPNEAESEDLNHSSITKSTMMMDATYVSKKRTVCEDSIDDILGQSK